MLIAGIEKHNLFLYIYLVSCKLETDALIPGDFVLFCFVFVGFFLHTPLNVREEKRKLVKICAFPISDSTDVNVTNTTQLKTIHSLE